MLKLKIKMWYFFHFFYVIYQEIKSHVFIRICFRKAMKKNNPKAFVGLVYLSIADLIKNCDDLREFYLKQNYHMCARVISASMMAYIDKSREIKKVYDRLEDKEVEGGEAVVQ